MSATKLNKFCQLVYRSILNFDSEYKGYNIPYTYNYDKIIETKTVSLQFVEINLLFFQEKRISLRLTISSFVFHCLSSINWLHISSS